MSNYNPTWASRQVDWWAVHEFVQPVLDAVGSWPMAGTLAWVGADPGIKAAALFSAAEHWALRVETAQAAVAEASRAVSAAVDWRKVAAEIRCREGAYIPRGA